MFSLTGAESERSDKSLGLVYCIPEFHDLTMDILPDATALIDQLKSAIESTNIESGEKNRLFTPPQSKNIVPEIKL